MRAAPSSTRSVVVVGAGAGGLACAIDLASAGRRVTLVEAGAAPGGKMRTELVAGRRVEAGPTVLTMRWVLDELFARAGRTLEAYVTLEPAEVLARHAWPDGSSLDLFADVARSEDAVGRLSGAADARAFRAFMGRCRRTYEAVEGPFLRSERPTPWSLARHVARHGVASMAHVDAHRTMWSALEATFVDRRLRQLFGRYATYCGSSPFTAPATLCLIAHVEGRGVHRVAGGMSALAAGLARLARDLGVTIRYDAPVSEILVRGRAAAGVRLASGEELLADAVVCAVDTATLASGELGAPAARSVRRESPEGRSFSAVTWAVVGRATQFPLLHHNVFFSEDSAAEFGALERARRMPASPTVYVCAQDRGDAASERSAERFLIIVNAPATGDVASDWGREERDACEKSTWATMTRCGLSLAQDASVMTTPVELHKRFPGTGGALYGARNDGPLSSLQRQGARTKTAGLYLAGGSVHPGPGVPMAALSGCLAAASLLEDQPSTAPSPTGATAGSTSTA